MIRDATPENSQKPKNLEHMSEDDDDNDSFNTSLEDLQNSTECLNSQVHSPGEQSGSRASAHLPASMAIGIVEDWPSDLHYDKDVAAQHHQRHGQSNDHDSKSNNTVNNQQVNNDQFSKDKVLSVYGSDSESSGKPENEARQRPKLSSLRSRSSSSSQLRIDRIRSPLSAQSTLQNPASVSDPTHQLQADQNKIGANNSSRRNSSNTDIPNTSTESISSQDNIRNNTNAGTQGQDIDLPPIPNIEPLSFPESFLSLSPTPTNSSIYTSASESSISPHNRRSSPPNAPAIPPRIRPPLMMESGGINGTDNEWENFSSPRGQPLIQSRHSSLRSLRSPSSSKLVHSASGNTLSRMKSTTSITNPQLKPLIYGRRRASSNESISSISLAPDHYSPQSSSPFLSPASANSELSQSRNSNSQLYHTEVQGHTAKSTVDLNAGNNLESSTELSEQQVGPPQQATVSKQISLPVPDTNQLPTELQSLSSRPASRQYMQSASIFLSSSDQKSGRLGISSSGSGISSGQKSPSFFDPSTTNSVTSDIQELDTVSPFSIFSFSKSRNQLKPLEGNFATRRLSKLGFSQKGRQSRSSPDLRAQYLSAVSEPLDEPPLPIRPSTSGSGASADSVVSTSSYETSTGSNLSLRSNSQETDRQKVNVTSHARSGGSRRSLRPKKSLSRLRKLTIRSESTSHRRHLRRVSRSMSPGYSYDYLPEPVEITSFPRLSPEFAESVFDQVKENMEREAAAAATAAAASSLPTNSSGTPSSMTSSTFASPVVAYELIDCRKSNDSEDICSNANQAKEQDYGSCTSDPGSSLMITNIDSLSSVSDLERLKSNISAKSSTSLVRTENNGGKLESSPIPSLTIAEKRKFRKRILLIRELIETEKIYLSDLKVADKYYRRTAKRQSFLAQTDINTIFAGLQDMIEFTTELLMNLNTAAGSVLSGADNDEKLYIEKESYIGESFLQVILRLEIVYRDFVHSHEPSVQRLHQLMSSPKVNRWLEACQQQSNYQTKAWNLETILIKPVQRLLKYPLLLKSLAECTAEEHPDKRAIDLAAHEIQKVADRINEDKRKADSGGHSDSRVRHDQGTGDTRKGVTKGLARSTEKFKLSVGISNDKRIELVDRSYDKLVDRFRRRHVELRTVLESFTNGLHTSLSTIETLYSIAISAEDWSTVVPSSKSPRMTLDRRWRALRMSVSEIQESDLSRFRNAVLAHVISPLENLLDLFERPQKFMMKRDRKVSDFKRFQNLRERGITPDKNVTALADSFTAINATLIAEIPLFLELVDRMVGAITANWVDIQARWYYNCARRIRDHCSKYISGMNHDFIEMDEIETGFLLKYTTIDDTIQTLSLCNGGMRALVASLDSSSISSLSSNGSSNPSTPIFPPYVSPNLSSNFQFPSVSSNPSAGSLVSTSRSQYTRTQDQTLSIPPVPARHSSHKASSNFHVADGVGTVGMSSGSSHSSQHKSLASSSSSSSTQTLKPMVTATNTKRTTSK
ncbi:hypothetical protein V1511DRAFT_508428 [Dipodascopsis uninucleata]